MRDDFLGCDAIGRGVLERSLLGIQEGTERTSGDQEAKNSAKQPAHEPILSDMWNRGFGRRRSTGKPLPRRPSPDPSPLSEARVGRCSSAAYLDAFLIRG